MINSGNISEKIKGSELDDENTEKREKCFRNDLILEDGVL